MDQTRKTDGRAMGAFGMVTGRCLPLSSIGGRLSIHGGEAIYGGETCMDTLQTLEWAASEGLLESTTIWDDEAAPWTPEGGRHEIGRAHV